MLKTKLTQILGGLTLIAAVALVIGCSADDNAARKSPVDKSIDTASAKIADKVVEAAFAGTSVSQTSDSNAAGQAALGDQSDRLAFTDILLASDKLYALFDGGLVVHDRQTEENVVVNTTDPLSAIAMHRGEIYVGGKYLYKLNLYSLDRQEGDFVGGIRALYSYDHLLMIGTEDGLYSLSVFGRQELADGITVTSLAADPTGLWVGTDGDGLYRWDGEGLKKRYLLRDSTLFDNIHTLDYQHNHLYVGTDKGLHIFDGGRWQNLSVDDGLPSNNVTSIDASDWVVFVGTDQGVVSVFDNEFTPVERLKDVNVAKLVRAGRRCFVASVGSGVVVTSDKLRKELIPPVLTQPSGTLTYAQ